MDHGSPDGNPGVTNADAIDLVMIERATRSLGRDVNTIAVASLMLAVAGFCGLFMFYIGLPFAIGAMVCGWIGLRRSRYMRGDGRRTAMVGLSLGTLMTVASIIGIIALLSGDSSG